MVGVGLVPKARSRSRTGCLTCRRRKKKCDEELYPICLNCNKKLLACEWPETKHELNKKLKQVRYVKNNPKKMVSPNIAETIPKRTTKLDGENFETLPPQDLGGKELQDYTLVAKSLPLPYMESYKESSSSYISFNVSELESSHEENLTESSIIRHSIDLGRPNNLDITDTDEPRRQHGYFLERIALQQDCVDSEEEVPPSLINSITTTSFTSYAPNNSNFLDANIASSEADSTITLQKSLSPKNADKFNSISYEDFIN